MSRTKKDLKSHKTGFGRWQDKPQRKLTPFIHDANKIAGKNEVLTMQPYNDFSQDGYNDGSHWYNAKTVRALRKQLRASRDDEKSRARTKIKQYDKKNLSNLEYS
jgi:hypothetical protein